MLHKREGYCCMRFATDYRHPDKMCNNILFGSKKLNDFIGSNEEQRQTIVKL